MATIHKNLKSFSVLGHTEVDSKVLKTIIEEYYGKFTDLEGSHPNSPMIIKVVDPY